jgi:hypothetical protein
MELSDLFPPAGRVQRLYCDRCEHHLDLSFDDFERDVSGVRIELKGLPVLLCPECGTKHYPDRSRLSLIELHRRAFSSGQSLARVTRNKITDSFGFTKVPFLFDADDYHYIPGLARQFDRGFLTPVFFNREALIKYDVHPSYRVRFASRTYGEIWQDNFSISFGINRNGKLLMWLGDIARLPENEQYYLRSENVPSDHSIGSEFYDGQIECKFTDPAPEDELFASRSDFIEAFHSRFGARPSHLDREVLGLAIALRRPVVDIPAECRNVADQLNKVYLESIDNGALGALVSSKGLKPKGTGNLKRLQALLEDANPKADIHNAMSPLYVLYDLRIAYSHLASDSSQEKQLAAIRQRLGLDSDAGLFAIYDAILPALARSFGLLGDAIGGAHP